MEKQEKRARKIIRRAFVELLKKKSFDDITVTEIVEAADYNRTTFYNYYLDKYHLAEEVATMYISNFLISLRNSYKHWDRNTLDQIKEKDFNLLDFIFTHRHEIRDISANNSSFKFSQALSEAVNWMAKSELSIEVNGEMAAFSDYTIEFIVGGLMSIISYWSSNDYRESPEEVKKIFINILNYLNEITVHVELMDDQLIEEKLQEIIRAHQEMLAFR